MQKKKENLNYISNVKNYIEYLKSEIKNKEVSFSTSLGNMIFLAITAGIYR
jgi:hypothetical protein